MTDCGSVSDEELIAEATRRGLGEPLEWCVVHDSPGVFTGPSRCLVWVVKADDNTAPIPCQFESQVRVGR